MSGSTRVIDRLKHTSLSLSESELRLSIIQEEALRRELASAETLRKQSPDVWKSMEAARSETNRLTALTNERLTALGLEPMRPRPSLAQRYQELQRLTRRNEAMIAAVKAMRAESAGERSGAPLAGRRSRRRR